MATGNILIVARIVILADVSDVLMLTCCRRVLFAHERAREIIPKEKSGHLDSQVVYSFLR